MPISEQDNAAEHVLVIWLTTVSSGCPDWSAAKYGYM